MTWNKQVWPVLYGGIDVGGVASSPNRRKSRQRIYSCLADLEIVTIGGNLPLLFSKGLHLRPYPFNNQKKRQKEDLIKRLEGPHVAVWQLPCLYLNNPCEASAERCQDGVNFWFDIAMKFAHYLKTICLHIQDRKFNNLLMIFFQGFTYQCFLSSQKDM